MRAAAKLELDVDYYSVLGLNPGATAEEVRRRYKKLVLECHPDKNPERTRWAERRVRELIQAFEVLGNTERRALFDKYRGGAGREGGGVPFFFHKKGPRARSLLILHHLLNEHGEEATNLLAEMEADYGEEFLLENLDARDYLDCLFLLGEHHLAQRNYEEAARRFRAFFKHECRERTPRHYFDEVVRQLKDLYLRKLPRVLPPLLLVGYLTEAAAFKLSPREELARLRRLAEAQVMAGFFGAARKSLLAILRISPKEDVVRLERLLEKAARGPARERR